LNWLASPSTFNGLIPLPVKSNHAERGQPPPFQERPQIGRILILGESGFIGGHVGEAFRKRSSSIEVTGRSAPALDFTREEDVEEMADLFDPRTAIVVLAGIKRQLGDNLDTFSQNMQMAVNLCRLLEKRPVNRVVFFSSAAVYGEEIHNLNITEETPVHPTSFYGAAKYTAECLFQKVVQARGESSLLILRPPLIYGPGDTGDGYGPSGFVRAALNGATINLWGDGEELREFIFIEDAAQIICCLTLSEHSGVLNLVSGKSYAYQDLLDSISTELGRTAPTSSRPRSKKRVDHGFSNAGLRNLLPDFRFTPPEEGIRRLIAAQGTS
jgi:UDP-glucose 4-epimerase